jgi:ABC-type polysaccharide/polyol phosphate transport system ATPase subunit
VVKRYWYYEHKTTSLRDAFIRAVRRKPLTVRHPAFSLEGFTLSVEPGEAVALVGNNGSGKSTVLRLVAGIYAPTAGEITTRGRVAAVLELGAGFHPDLTGRENASLYGAILGLGRAELKERLPGILRFAGVDHALDTPVKYWSSGMHSRLAFSVALGVRPDVLLLDEVLAVGDAGFRARCEARLSAWHRAGGTLIVTSHDADSLRRLCRRAVWLEAGRIRRDGPVGEVLDAYARGGAGR